MLCWPPEGKVVAPVSETLVLTVDCPRAAQRLDVLRLLCRRCSLACRLAEVFLHAKSIS